MGIGNFGIWEMLVIGLIVLIFFGPRRLPEIARSMGKAMREFKKGVNEIQRELELADRETRRATAADWKAPPKRDSGTGTKPEDYTIQPPATPDPYGAVDEDAEPAAVRRADLLADAADPEPDTLTPRPVDPADSPSADDGPSEESESADRGSDRDRPSERG